MKKERREPYQYLANIVGMGLCNFCKYAEWEGSSCCDSELNCQCKFADISDNCCDVWGGGDCWAYRPNKSFQKIGMEVGIFLEGNIPHLNRKGEMVAIVPNDNDRNDYPDYFSRVL